LINSYENYGERSETLSSCAREVGRGATQANAGLAGLHGDLELAGREAEGRKRWEFLVSAAPAAVPGATGLVLNPVATF